MAAATLWLAREPLILASRSAGRRALLEAAGIPVQLHPAGIDERAAEGEARAAGADAEGVAAALAAAKALAVSRDMPGRVVLGADQTLAVDGAALHKPASLEEAAGHLRLMGGRNHQLHSAVHIRRGDTVLLHTVETATLHMRALSEAMIRRYCEAAGDAVLSSVGAYQLEGLGIHLFERIEGDHFTIVGLPMLPVLDALRRAGLVQA
jgi:septum formation protein